MKRSVLFLCVIICSNCTPKTTGQTILTNENIYEEAKLHAEIAKDICICSNQVIETYKDINGLTEDEKKNQSEVLEQKLKIESKKSELCIENLMSKKFNGLIIDENLMEAALKENCIDFYNMFKIGRM